MNDSLFKAHCKDTFPREFAYKPLPGESPLNVVRIRQVNSLDALNRLINTFSNRQGLYVSVYAYSTPVKPSRRLIYESAIIDRLYFDFDSKDDPSLAIHETKTVMRAIGDRGIESIQYFSGQKGTACYIDFPPTDIAPENKKDVLGLVWDMINDGIGLQLHTLDGGSVRGDIARVSRLPNTKHQSGLYCIPLEKSELLRGTEYIRRLAQEPRRDFDLEGRIKENIRSNSTTVPGLLKALEELVIVRKEEAEETKPKPIIRKSQNTRGFVTQEQIQRARSFPISEILGNKKMALCPFHNDGVPSLSIDHNRGLWHCFACNRSGNVIQLVMKLEGLSFKSAVKKLGR
jgi:hypothetical protein